MLNQVIVRILALACIATATACGGGSSGSYTPDTTTINTTTTSTAASLAAGYKLAKWGSNVTVSFSGDCSMTVSTNGLPDHSLPSYYLKPVSTTYPTVAGSNGAGQLSVQPNTNSTSPSIVTYNICPTKAASTSATNMGTIGMMISGAALFNGAEAAGAAAASDNVSVVAPDGSTASFIDTCSGHYTPANAGSAYHYHAVSSCVTAKVDTAGGASHLIGVALDGFPIYGGYDLSGRAIAVSELDACNGITSATPEFPSGIYHYVLPVGVTSLRSSLACYAGTVSRAQIAMAQSLGICVSPAKAIQRAVVKTAAVSRKSLGATNQI